MRRVQGPSVYAYRFDWDEEPSVLGADVGRMLGAAHFMEVPFVFGQWQIGPKKASARVRRGQRARGASRSRTRCSRTGGEFAWKGSPGRGRDGKAPGLDGVGSE